MATKAWICVGPEISITRYGFKHLRLESASKRRTPGCATYELPWTRLSNENNTNEYPVLREILFQWGKATKLIRVT